MTAFFLGKKAKKRNLISIITTSMIILALIIAGPVQAVKVNIKADKSVYNKDSTITFTTAVDIQRNERVPIKKLTLKIMDSKDRMVVECEFDPDGTEACGDFDITPVNSGMGTDGERVGEGFGYEDEGDKLGTEETDFGFGYGFEDETRKSGFSGELKYEIEWDSTAVADGKYKAVLEAYAEDTSTHYTYLSKNPESFNIRPISKTKITAKATARAKDGGITSFEEITEFDKEKVTFNTNLRKTYKDGAEDVAGTTSLSIDGEAEDGTKVKLSVRMRSNNYKELVSFTKDKIEVIGNGDTTYYRKEVGDSPVRYRKTMEDIHFVIENGDVSMWIDGLFRVDTDVTQFSYKE